MDQPAWMPKTSYEWTTTPSGNTFWGPLGAAGILFHHPESDTYLLGHRSPEVHHGDTWGIPGGAIDPGESPYQAALREAREEFGTVPQHTVVKEHQANPDPDWAYHTFVAEVPQKFDPEYANDWETQGHGWFTPQEIEQLPLHPGFASTWNSGALRKQAAMTRTQYLRLAQELEEERGPDTSQVLHTFPDGWSIRSPQSPDDHWREGQLMSNCIGYNQIGIEKPGTYQSLRDPDNLPHATWSMSGPPAALGRHNYPVKPDYYHYLEQWGVPIGDPDEEYQKWMDFAMQKHAKHGYFFHTAPREYREEIERYGLLPTHEAPQSPWEHMDADPSFEREQQPTGVYMWDDPANARGYAYNLQGRKGEHFPGDNGGEDSIYESPEFEDYEAAYPGERDENYEPVDWDDYDKYMGNFKRPPLYDIWKVNTLGLPEVYTDPEMAIHHGEMTAEEAQRQMNEEAKYNGGREQEYDPWNIERSEGHRWYVPHAIQPERLTLHDSIYPEDMTLGDYENTNSAGKEVPNAWHQVPLEEWNENAQKRYLGDPNVMREIEPQDQSPAQWTGYGY